MDSWVWLDATEGLGGTGSRPADKKLPIQDPIGYRPFPCTGRDILSVAEDLRPEATLGIPAGTPGSVPEPSIQFERASPRQGQGSSIL